MQLSQNMIFSP